MDKLTVIAYCTWFERIGGDWQHWNGAEFVPYDRLARRTATVDHVCRASIGERIITLWLPGGAKIRLGRSAYGYDDGRHVHYYGSTTRKLIEIFIPAAVQKRATT